jgi:hypothetical protein
MFAVNIQTAFFVADFTVLLFGVKNSALVLPMHEFLVRGD